MRLHGVCEARPDRPRPDYEAGRMPTQEEIAEMMKYNEELAKAGVMAAGDGLHRLQRPCESNSAASATTLMARSAESKELSAATGSGMWPPERKRSSGRPAVPCRRVTSWRFAADLRHRGLRRRHRAG